MKKLLPVWVFLIITTISNAQDWVVPADRQGKLSPFGFTDSTILAGTQIYNTNCRSCHGTPGLGNVQPLTPRPLDPSTAAMQQNSDGALYYKIFEGRVPMPSFKTALSSNEIWAVISYIRSFNSAYVQSVMPEITSGAYPGALISIALSLNPAKDTVVMKIKAVKDNTSVPVINAGVRLFAQRTFGLLPLDEEQVTDANGYARFGVPSGIPGDTAGNIMFSARFTNEDMFGAVSKDTLLQAGVKVLPVSLTKERAMWNTVGKAPWWILLTFGSGVLIVWGFIFAALFKLRDIYIIGEHFDTKNQTDNRLSNK